MTQPEVACSSGSCSSSISGVVASSVWPSPIGPECQIPVRSGPRRVEQRRHVANSPNVDGLSVEVEEPEDPAHSPVLCEARKAEVEAAETLAHVRHVVHGHACYLDPCVRLELTPAAGHPRR